MAYISKFVPKRAKSECESAKNRENKSNWQRTKKEIVKDSRERREIHLKFLNNFIFFNLTIMSNLERINRNPCSLLINSINY